MHKNANPVGYSLSLSVISTHICSVFNSQFPGLLG